MVRPRDPPARPQAGGPASRERTLYRGAPLSVAPGELLSEPLRLEAPPAAPLGDYEVRVRLLLGGAELDASEIEVTLE